MADGNAGRIFAYGLLGFAMVVSYQAWNNGKITAGSQARAKKAGRPLREELQMVVTDVEMPRMDGYSLTARIKGDKVLGVLPVIMHSSLAGEANLRKGRQAGCDEYMVKFEPKALLGVIEKYLEAPVAAP